MNQINQEKEATTLFRESTGLPMNSSDDLLPETIACCIEETAETIDGAQDMLVTYMGAALQCTDTDKIEPLIDYCDSILKAMEVLSFDSNFSRSEVLAANLSKLCSTDDEVRDTVYHYTKMGLKTTVREVGKLKAVYCDETATAKDGKFFPRGKLLKNVGWRGPKFDAENFAEWFGNKDILRVFGYGV